MKKVVYIVGAIVAVWVIAAFVVSAVSTSDDNSCPVRAGQSVTKCVHPNGADLGNDDEGRPPEEFHPKPVR
jgi:hypothetical protein